MKKWRRFEPSSTSSASAEVICVLDRQTGISFCWYSLLLYFGYCCSFSCRQVWSWPPALRLWFWVEFSGAVASPRICIVVTDRSRATIAVVITVVLPLHHCCTFVAIPVAAAVPFAMAVAFLPLHFYCTTGPIAIALLVQCDC